ncbi:ABC transporter substrate-binding protein [Pseudooceanicola onchidii]|uniref:ABC transporter substrate-binding protein n=1 Tax=Pseudooceanicola onchidii TaxID=2562279 RepID=UPI0010AA526A|nr:ABC transporter substrate-binding protein [Pseudooceanicola onchidii]
MKKILIGGLLAVTIATSAFGQDKQSAEYQAMIEASKQEDGLLVYSNLPTFIWDDFIALLAETYPWVKMETTDMGDELWERYYAESGSKTRTADLISTTAPNRYAEFIDRGEIEPYVSVESDALPEWSNPEPGLYTVSASPAIMVYNKITLPTPPDSLHGIAEMIQADPAKMNGKVSTYDASSNSFGTAMFATWLQKDDNTWDVLDIIGSATRPESGAGVQREKVMTGEYDLAFFFNSVSLISLSKPEVQQLVGWSYITDGTPVSLQGAAVTKAATSPNTAKIVLDLMLSKEGQIALAKRGLTPYREDVEQGDLPFPVLKTAADKIGEENLIYYSYDRDVVNSWPDVVTRWSKAFK